MKTILKIMLMMFIASFVTCTGAYAQDAVQSNAIEETSMLTYILLAVAGGTIMLLMNLNTIKQKGQTIKEFLTERWASYVLNVVVAIVIIYISYNDKEPLLKLSMEVSVMLGACGQEVMKRLFQTFSNKVPTIIGNNGDKTS